MLSLLDAKAVAEIGRVLDVAAHEDGQWVLSGKAQKNLAAYRCG